MLQVSLSLSDLGELQECCCGEWNVPLHHAWFICSGCTYGMDRDTKRLTNVLAGTQDSPNQERLILLLWVGFDNCVFIGTSRWGGFSCIYHEDVNAKCVCSPKLSVMPMSGIIALVTSLNTTWMQFFADCDSDFREILVACELAASCARIARYPQHGPPGRWPKGKPIPPGLLKDYSHGYPPPLDHQP